MPFLRDRRGSALMFHWRWQDGVTAAGVPVTMDGRFTGAFARAGIKRVVDATGRPRIVPEGLPALHHVYNAATGLWVPTGYLVEPASANVWSNPNDLSNAAWTKTRVTAALTATSPEGVANAASTVFETADNDTHFYSRASSAFTANTTQSQLVAIRAIGRARGRCYFVNGADSCGVTYDLTAETVVAHTGGVGTVSHVRLQKLIGGWYLVEFAGKVNASATSATFQHDLADDGGSFAGHAGDTTKGIQAYCLQHEVDRVLPSSMIPAAATRAADAMTFVIPWLPRDATLDIEVVDHGTFQVAGARCVQLGDDDSGTASSIIISCVAAGDARVRHENASASVDSDLTSGATAVGDTVKVRAPVLGAGFTAGRSINAANEVLGSAAGALAHPAGYAEAVLSCTPNGFIGHAMRAIKFVAGDRSRAFLDQVS